jgi:hypothetical protein
MQQVSCGRDKNYQDGQNGTSYATIRCPDDSIHQICAKISPSGLAGAGKPLEIGVQPRGLRPAQQ